jgi:hypothetical protein
LVKFGCLPLEIEARVLIWVNPQASWNGMLARDLLLVQPMLYRDVRGTDMTIAHRLWRAICKANWIAIEPFPIAIELMDLAHVPTAWKRASVATSRHSGSGFPTRRGTAADFLR